jgi:hypothetical protein
MLEGAEDSDTDALQIADDQIGIMPRYAPMWKAGQVAVRDRHTLHGAGQMPKPLAKDLCQFDRCRTRPGADQITRFLNLSVLSHRARHPLAAESLCQQDPPEQ